MKIMIACVCFCLLSGCHPSDKSDGNDFEKPYIDSPDWEVNHVRGYRTALVIPDKNGRLMIHYYRSGYPSILDPFWRKRIVWNKDETGANMETRK